MSEAVESETLVSMSLFGRVYSKVNFYCFKLHIKQREYNFRILIILTNFVLLNWLASVKIYCSVKSKNIDKNTLFIQMEEIILSTNSCCFVLSRWLDSSFDQGSHMLCASLSTILPGHLCYFQRNAHCMSQQKEISRRDHSDFGREQFYLHV